MNKKTLIGIAILGGVIFFALRGFGGEKVGGSGQQVIPYFFSQPYESKKEELASPVTVYQFPAEPTVTFPQLPSFDLTGLFAPTPEEQTTPKKETTVRKYTSGYSPGTALQTYEKVGISPQITETAKKVAQEPVKTWYSISPQQQWAVTPSQMGATTARSERSVIYNPATGTWV
jgi:hypothetical protein